MPTCQAFSSLLRDEGGAGTVWPGFLGEGEEGFAQVIAPLTWPRWREGAGGLVAVKNLLAVFLSPFHSVFTYWFQEVSFGLVG